MGQTILETAAIVAAGMMTGNELCVSIFHAMLPRANEPTQFELGKASATVFGKFMPFWYAATLLLSGAAAYSLRGTGRASLLADIAALFLVSIVYTVTLLVPINTQIASWQWDTRPTDWAQARQTWDTRHGLRVSLLVLATICLVLACVMPRGQ